MKFLKTRLFFMLLITSTALSIIIVRFMSNPIALLENYPPFNEFIYNDQVALVNKKIAQVEVKLNKKKENPNLKYLQSNLRDSSLLNFTQYYISNSKELYGALNEISDQKSSNNILILEDGTYQIASTINITRPNTFIISFSGTPSAVVLQGGGMFESSGVMNIFTVKAPGFLLDGVTLKEVSNHLIQVKGEDGADFPIIRNCILQDSYQQLIKVTTGSENRPSESGIIENCLFEYSAGIGPNFYIGGIDAHGVTNWLIRKNVFKYIASPSQQISEYAVHLWGNSQSNIVDSNIIIDSDRGIGFGMGTNKGDTFSNFSGVISNNVIFHSDNAHIFADTGICLENSPKTLIAGNYIYLKHDYDSAIEYRFVGSQQISVQNNHVNKEISSRNGGQAELTDNNKELKLVDFLIKMDEVLSIIEITNSIEP